MRILLWLGLFAGCVDTGVHADVSYDDRYGSATTMDIHVPAKHAANRPAIMLIHGGAWRGGDKEHYTQAAERYAAAGYVAATINYRLVPTGTYPAAVQDCLCALSFLRTHASVYGIDPTRIAVSGYSAGGHLSALVGIAASSPSHQPDCEWGPTAQPAAAIPADGIYKMRPGDGFMITDFVGDDPEAFTAASPIDNVHAGAPPFLVIHGTDDVVPVDNARELADTLRDAGAPMVRVLELGASGHLHGPVTATGESYLQAATDTPEAWAVTFDFLAQTMGAP